jgi:hypothetical protein
VRGKLLLVAGVALFLAAALVGWFIRMHPEINGWLIAVGALIAVIVVIYIISFMSSRIAGHWASHAALRAEVRAAELEAAEWERERKARLEAERQAAEAAAWERRRRELAEDRKYQLEQQKLILEREKLQAEHRAKMAELQAIRLKNNEVLAMRRGDGVDIAYMPPVRIDRIIEQDTIEGAPVAALPAPAIPNALQLYKQGVIGSRPEIMLGYDENGLEVWRPWKIIKAVLILGLQGGGKTRTAIWLFSQELMRGGRLALIDKHARAEEDSMYQAVRPFEPLFVAPVGDTPAAALRVINRASRIFAEREAGGRCEYPFILVVDEFTAIIRQKGTDGQWAEVAEKLTKLLEDLNTEGRKFKCYAICLGQAANATRSGGTEVRDTFNTRIAHTMREKQAQMLGLNEEKKQVRRLENGQAVVDIEGRDEPFFLQIPHATDEYIAELSRRLVDAPPAAPSPWKYEELVPEMPFNGRSTEVLSSAMNGSENGRERRTNALEHSIERLPERARKVLELKKMNVGKQAIVEELWQVKKGGSEKYRLAVAEYTQIVETLVTLGYVKVEQ